jgi:hypothetical protein
MRRAQSTVNGNTYSGSTLEFKPSRKKALWVLVGCTAFVALGVFIVFLPARSPTSFFPPELQEVRRVLVGWGTIIFFGLGIPISIYQLFNQQPILKFNHDGLSYGRKRASIIPWNQIVSMRTLRLHRTEFVCLKLTHIEKYHLGSKFTLAFSQQLGL